ncbi:predicted protein [Nematostella vectensis]|uniref:DUF6570 domain-containing protein n=1 Tax=Nematostella vectensis TaxID=45351 RepID=A7SKP6_NEMVE|nr:predicted protein [Nematostella vectensis]|eukprot:XP_001627807.1 predicted protein [Nematostella vectensis]
MAVFVKEKINSSEVSFWDPIPKLKVNNFDTVTKRVQVKATNEKLVTVGSDWNLFGRLLIAANARQVDLKGVLAHELSSVPYALAHQDGSLRKTNKSALAGIIEANVDVPSMLPPTTKDTVHLIDAMALVQAVKSGGSNTFGELAVKYFSVITGPMNSACCKMGDVNQSGRTIKKSCNLNFTRGPDQWTCYPYSKTMGQDLAVETLKLERRATQPAKHVQKTIMISITQLNRDNGGEPSCRQYIFTVSEVVPDRVVAEIAFESHLVVDEEQNVEPVIEQGMDYTTQVSIKDVTHPEAHPVQPPPLVEEPLPLVNRARTVDVKYEYAKPGEEETTQERRTRHRRITRKVIKEEQRLREVIGDLPPPPPPGNTQQEEIAYCAIREFEVEQLSYRWSHCQVCKERRIIGKNSKPADVCSRCKKDKERYCIKGPLHRLPQAVQEPATILPRLPADVDIIRVRRKGMEDTNKEFRVRRRRVERALYWLQQNNPVYADVTIDIERIESLPLDGDLPDIRTVEFAEDVHHQDNQGPAPQQLDAGETDMDESTFSGILLPEPGVNVAERIQSAVDGLIAEENEEGRDQAQNEHQRNSAQRVVHNMIMRKRALEQSRYFVDQQLGDPLMTVADLQERMARGNNTIANKLMYFGASLSCAELYFPPLRRLLEQYILDTTGEAVNLLQEHNARFKAVQENTHVLVKIKRGSQGKSFCPHLMEQHKWQQVAAGENVGRRDVSGPEASFELSGLALWGCSRQFSYISMKGSRRLEKNEDTVTSSSSLDRYLARARDEFCSWYRFAAKNGKVPVMYEGVEDFQYDDGGEDFDWSRCTVAVPEDVDPKAWLQDKIEEEEEEASAVDSELILPDVSPLTLNEEQRSIVSLILVTLQKYLQQAEDYVPLRLVVSGTGGTGELTQIIRQAESKRQLRDVLMSMRTYSTTAEKVHWLQQFQWHNLGRTHGEGLLRRMYEEGFFVFPTHRLEWTRNKIKILECNRIPGHPVAKMKAQNNGYHAQKADSNKAGSLLQRLYLCRDSKVMLVANLESAWGLFNGAVGRVVDMVYLKGSRPTDDPPPLPDYVMVRFVSYSGPVLIPVPLRLAWGITTHNCQGMTVGDGEPFRYVVIHPGKYAFEAKSPGALFVALSKAKSAAGTLKQQLPVRQYAKINCKRNEKANNIPRYANIHKGHKQEECPSPPCLPPPKERLGVAKEKGGGGGRKKKKRRGREGPRLTTSTSITNCSQINS